MLPADLRVFSNGTVTLRHAPEYEVEWLEAHMAVAEARLGKPLLLEEFGKRLASSEADAGAITRLRDPVYETSFAAVAKSIAMCGPGMCCSCVSTSQATPSPKLRGVLHCTDYLPWDLACDEQDWLGFVVKVKELTEIAANNPSQQTLIANRRHKAFLLNNHKHGRLL